MMALPASRGRRRRSPRPVASALATALALVCAAAPAGSCGGADAVATDDPAATFAPLVRIAADEPHPPVGADWFLAGSTLWFADERCGDRKVAVGAALAAQRTDAVDWLYDFGLGRGPAYFRSPYVPGGCEDRRDVKVFANERNRPFDRLERPAGLGPRDGFFLDLRDSARGGRRSAIEAAGEGGAAIRVPAYVERHRAEVDGADGLRLTYWLLFPMHAPPGREAAAREGDWERVDVVLRTGDGDGEYEPRSVRVTAAGGGVRELAWDDLELAEGGDGAHVVLEAARGSHTLAPSREGEPCAGCAEWRTWERLLGAPRQRWYGFGGAWGELGRDAGTTGPLGPHGEWSEDGGVRELPDGWHEAVETTDPVRTFAPLVHLHARERHFPLGAADFIRHSMLTFGIDGCPVEQIAQGRGWPDANVHGLPWTRPRRLGGDRPYRFEPPADGCDRRFPRGYATTDHTRPYDRGRDPSLRPGEGFFLDIASHRYSGDRSLVEDGRGRVLDGVPAYFERRPERVDGAPGLRIVYWLLYAATKPVGDERASVAAREGGWERVGVLLRRGGPHRYVPESVRYHVRGDARDVEWSEARRAGGRGGDGGDATHPVAVSARGSHAPYPEPGRRPWALRVDGERIPFRDDARICAACPRWRTWERLLAVREQPWWGYGGGWGIAFAGDRQSGPLGPSPHRSDIGAR